MTFIQRVLSLSLAVFCAAAPLASTAATAPALDAQAASTERIAPYVPRFGRLLSFGFE